MIPRNLAHHGCSDIPRANSDSCTPCIHPRQDALASTCQNNRNSNSTSQMNAPSSISFQANLHRLQQFRQQEKCCLPKEMPTGRLPKVEDRIVSSCSSGTNGFQGGSIFPERRSFQSISYGANSERYFIIRADSSNLKQLVFPQLCSISNRRS